MAVTVNITEAIGLTNWDKAESSGAWTGFRHAGGGTPTPTNETEVFIQGTQAVSIKTSGTTRDEGLYAVKSAVDMSTDANKHVYVWAAASTMSQHDTIAGGGLYIIIGSSAANWNKYFVAGSDTVGGEFKRYVIDITKTPSETAATAATLTAVTHVGIGVKGTITAKATNVVVDRIDYGTGLQIEGGSVSEPGTWQALFDADDNVSNKYGIIEKRSGVYFLKGGLMIGDDSGTQQSRWDDQSNSTVVFENPQYHDGTGLISSITAEDLYKIEIRGNATSPLTETVWGSVVGAGDDRQGVGGGAIQTAGPGWTFDGASDVAHWSKLEMYGMQIQGCDLFEADVVTKSFLFGCTFTGCGIVDPKAATWINNAIVSPNRECLQLGAAASTNIQKTRFVYSAAEEGDATRVWNVDVSATPDLFVEYTDEFASAATADVLFFPATEAAGDYCAFGFDRRFSRLRITLSTAGVGGTVIWEWRSTVAGGSWAPLANVVDGTAGFTAAAGTYDVDFRIPDDTWQKDSLRGELSQYFIRARVLTTYSTNPVGTNGSIRQIAEYMTHSSIDGTVDADDLTFFGSGVNFKDIVNTLGSTLVDSYAFTNRNVNQSIGASGITAAGQSFTGTAGEVSVLRMSIFRQGTLTTGDIWAEIYAHSGTFGTSSVPTGSPLATSNTIDVTTLSANQLEVDFEFEDKFTMTATTKYVLVVQGSAIIGGTFGQTIQIGMDTTSPSHAGNSSVDNFGWSADAGRDLVFELFMDAIVEVSATNGTNMSEDASFNQTNPGAIIITNNLAITFSSLIIGSEVRVYLTGTNIEVDGIETTAGTTFGFAVGSAVAVDYVILGPIPAIGEPTYVPIRVESISWTVATEIVIAQQINRNFSDPA